MMMMMRNGLAAIALVTLPLVAGAAPARAHHHAAQTASDTAQIEAWGRNWKRFFEAGDTDSLRAMYEPDAVLMAHGSEPQIGVDAILAFLGRNKAVGNRVRIDFANEDISIDGDRAYLTAKYWMTITPASGAGIDVMGRSFLVYKKGADGTWRLWRDMDNQAPDVRAEDRPAG